MPAIGAISRFGCFRIVAIASRTASGSRLRGRKGVLVRQTGAAAALHAVLHEGEVFTDERNERILIELGVVLDAQGAGDEAAPGDGDLAELLGWVSLR